MLCLVLGVQLVVTLACRWLACCPAAVACRPIRSTYRPRAPVAFLTTIAAPPSLTPSLPLAHRPRPRPQLLQDRWNADGYGNTILRRMQAEKGCAIESLGACNVGATPLPTDPHDPDTFSRALWFHSAFVGNDLTPDSLEGFYESPKTPSRLAIAAPGYDHEMVTVQVDAASGGVVRLQLEWGMPSSLLDDPAAQQCASPELLQRAAVPCVATDCTDHTLGNGRCNPVNNNCGCNWDDGDCCGFDGIDNQYALCEPGEDGTCCLDPNQPLVGLVRALFIKRSLPPSLPLYRICLPPSAALPFLPPLSPLTPRSVSLLAQSLRGSVSRSVPLLAVSLLVLSPCQSLCLSRAGSPSRSVSLPCCESSRTADWETLAHATHPLPLPLDRPTDRPHTTVVSRRWFWSTLSTAATWCGQLGSCGTWTRGWSSTDATSPLTLA